MTTETPKDLDHYLANLGELPDDPAAIDALLGLKDEAPEEDREEELDDENGEQGEEGAAPGATDGKASKEQDQGKDKDDAAPENQTGEEEAPVASKDGKHTIPYAVLAAERERRQAAERVTQELHDRIKDLEARASTAGQGRAAQSSQAAATPETLLSDEDMAALVEDFPAVKKLIDYTRALEGKVGQFESRFAQLEEQEQARAEEAANAQRAVVREAVDANPVLRYWEQQDPEKWAAAIEADTRLSQLPVNSGLSLGERFAKAVQIVETIYGQTDLPEGYAPKVSNATSSKGKTTDENLAAKAQAAVEKAGQFKPRTLSDMPGGTAPAADPLEDLASMSTGRLGAQMQNMTPDQINALLRRLG